MLDFEKSFIILGKAGMSPNRDFHFLLACVQPPPRLYTGYFTYPIGFFNVMLFLNQHYTGKWNTYYCRTKVTVMELSQFRVLRY